LASTSTTVCKLILAGKDAASNTSSTESFPEGKQPGGGVITNLHLAPRLKKEQNHTSTPLSIFKAGNTVKFIYFSAFAILEIQT
jgi:hypothetical protein